MTDPAGRVVCLYDEQAEGWIADRGRALGGPGKSLDEVAALDRFVAALPVGARVLDVGCGSGWPMGAALLERGLHLTGVDASPRLIAHAARTLPTGEWIVGDMRTFDLGRVFDGVLVWHSLFHLNPGDQRVALGRILDHAAATSTVLLTEGGEAGVSLGQWRGERLYHASLGAAAYQAILGAAGFAPDKAATAPPHIFLR
ncbi:class I SAM-dependent methyltransferase [Brevundimonas aurifodinae]|uniref:Class I SAM-dependent methyltransferase n=2 Tax=Brevundimonas TaxID=41275 RepID=A0ABV1NIY1_9CAUL|nr:MAG: hypothetical protein B7Z42_02315 [Brevundimonas sp. 12-68-7]OYX34889.1 MAG: hypothetical protein B7Z01_04975 [Brevundimonas subvibrioides]